MRTFSGTLILPNGAAKLDLVVPTYLAQFLYNGVITTAPTEGELFDKEQPAVLSGCAYRTRHPASQHPAPTNSAITSTGKNVTGQMTARIASSPKIPTSATIPRSSLPSAASHS